MRNAVSTLKADGSGCRVPGSTDVLRKPVGRFLRFVFGGLCLVLALTTTVSAQQAVREILNADGNVVFYVDFWANNSGAYWTDASGPYTSSGTFTAAEIDTIVQGLQYWVDVLKKYGEMPVVLDEDGNPVTDIDGNPVHQPVRIRIAKVPDANAYAQAVVIVTGEDGFLVTGAQGLIADGTYIPPNDPSPITNPTQYAGGAHAIVRMGTGLNMQIGPQGQLSKAAYDMQAVLIHELGHALGVMSTSTAVRWDSDKLAWIYQFSDPLSRWDAHLRDNNGNAPYRNQTIGYDINKRGDVFDLGDPTATENPSKPTFVGTNTLEVYYDGDPELIERNLNYGVPIMGYTQNPYYWVDGADQWIFNGGGTLSHIDTTHSLMSWQDYRNYPYFIEVELATLQDIGYDDILRRDYFGRSFYVNGDGETQIVNTSNFGKWDPVTETYSSTEPNTSTFGVGVHLYASNLNILQTGTILADGTAGGGARIAGRDNTFTVADGTLIRANGLNGTGLVVSYGTGHHIINRGTIRATGTNGVGAHFHFGSAVIGDMRGSYFYDRYENAYLTELQGAMVDAFDITGTVAGSATTSQSRQVEVWSNVWVTYQDINGGAIVIGNTAHVDNINVMRGADIDGDILSFFNGNQTTQYGITQMYGAGTSTVSGSLTELGRTITSASEPYMNLGSTLTFGYKADESGAATDEIDKGFRFTYDHNINVFVDDQGRDVIALGTIDAEFVGGITEFRGNRSFLREVRIGEEGTLTLTRNGGVSTQLYLTDGMHNQGRLSGVGTIYTSINTSGYYNMPWEFLQLGRQSGRVQNDGWIAPGESNGLEIGTLNIEGSLYFGKESGYEVTIGANRSSGNYGECDLIRVSGETGMDGTLHIVVLPGNYDDDPTHYRIIRSGSYVAGSNFTDYRCDMAFINFVPVRYEEYDLNHSPVYISSTDPRYAQFTVIRDMEYFRKHARTHNERAVATAIDTSLFAAPQIAFSLGNYQNTPEDLRYMYDRIGASIRANSAMMNLWNPSELIFNRVGWGNGQMETGNRGRVNWDRMMGRTHRMLGRGQASFSRRSGSLWGDVFNTTFNTESDGNSHEYDFSRTGFMVGGEWNLTSHSAIGAIAAYADTRLKQTGDRVDSDDYLLGLYFVCAPFDEFEFKSYIGLGFQEYDMNRYIVNPNIYHETGKGINDRYVSNTKGNSMNISVELARPLMLHPTFILRPTLGIDAQHIWQNGFRENTLTQLPESYGSNIYALKYSRMHYYRTLFRVGFSSETTGPRGGIRMRAFYVKNIGSDDYPSSSANFSTGGSGFTVRGTDLGGDYLNLGVGANYWLDGGRTCSLFFDYDANIYGGSSKKTYAHAFNIGLLQNF